MPIRNPFARRPAAHDENTRPESPAGNIDVAHPGFERVDTVGSKASSALSIRSRKSQDTGEYKMSVVNDSGVYLPPSPVEKEATWPRRYLSRASSDAKSTAAEIEHFPISRESFDSYRRSFPSSTPFGAARVVVFLCATDISAKSPVVAVDPSPRQSLDSGRFSRLPPRSALSERRFGHGHCGPYQPPTPEESFEDVGLNDDGKNNQQSQGQQQPKKRSFFAKFGSDSAAPEAPVANANSQAMSRFLTGRKRGQSGQGAELGAIPSPISDRPMTENSLQEQEVQS
ncbi:hypothetical protein B0H67DRAFT_478316 [Lasiosphaeris hirsuta]|uniref:Uncharacterized protein n=1 Tax=Lasiosphaeris hirsuta TaxID=260670 RepID=A0AA40BAV4_9PEZI|nr:hypothetical protein B0H67DRAFT_478316 [Lasiosphaeris hirsuta]